VNVVYIVLLSWIGHHARPTSTQDNTVLLLHGQTRKMFEYANAVTKWRSSIFITFLVKLY